MLKQLAVGEAGAAHGRASCMMSFWALDDLQDREDRGCQKDKRDAEPFGREERLLE